jgi:peptidoglycan/LPS O-acetylase OafA/YrhL
MRVFGIIVTSLGIVACIFAAFVAMDGTNGDYRGLAMIAVSIAAIGVVFAGKILLENSN